MSIAALILGESGTGKSTSLRNLDPTQTLLIQAVAKPLPFRASGWKVHAGKESPGNIIRTDDPGAICKTLQKTQRPVIVIDDWQYILANQYMRRTSETGYQKFTDIAKSAWEILTVASNLPGNQRVYMLAHTDRSEDGQVRCKTIGKMLNEKITVEGLVTICLRTFVQDGNYFFSTRNSGNDTTKSPLGLFEEHYIPNDLKQVDDQIAAFYAEMPA